jgi:chemotaxis signal transduction protein
MVSITPSPEPLHGIAGTINLHGMIIVVYSVRELFGLEKRLPLLSDNLVIAQKNQTNVALWVEETCMLQEDELIPEEQFDHVQSMIPGIRIIRSDLVVLCDLNAFLDCGKKTGVRLVDILPKGAADTIRTAHELSLRDYQDVVRVLTKRALELALPEEEKKLPSVIEVIRFNLMFQEYAVEMKYIKEVIQTSEIIPVPGTPDFIAGICSIRGEIISLVDLRVLLSLPERGLTDLNRVIVLTDGKLTFGILADQITGIGSLNMEDIIKTDNSNETKWHTYIYGTIESLHILNAQALLTDPRMIIDDTET